MNIDFTSRPWTEFVTLHKDGKLEDDEFFDEPEGEEFENKCFSFWEMTDCDSCIFYEQIGYVNHLILQHEFKGKEEFSKFTEAMFTENYSIDIEGFEEVNDCVVGLYSDERMKGISMLTKSFDIEEINNIQIEHFEEKGYLEYMKSMIELVNKCADNNHGLEIFMG